MVIVLEKLLIEIVYTFCQMQQLLQKLPLLIVHTKAVHCNSAYIGCQLNSAFIQNFWKSMLHTNADNCKKKGVDYKKYKN